MFRLFINFLIEIIILFLCAIVVACGFEQYIDQFIDLRPIKYTIEPDGFDSVLPEEYSPLTISFDTEMVKKDAEGIFQVSSDLGSVKGDFSWQDNCLYFTPVAGWTPGIRYAVNLSGTISSADGRELRIQEYAAFYTVNREDAPILVYAYPPDSQAVDTDDFFLELHFSRSMNRLSVESAFAINGVSNKYFEWLDDDKNLKVTSDKPLSAWTVYGWSLKDSAKSIDGVPLPKAYSGSFTTDLDQLLPEVKKVYPVVFTNGIWIATGADIKKGLSLNEGIAVEFNKPMGDSVLRSLRFEPSLSGRTEMLDEKTIIYILSRNLEPETEYTLFVSSETKDTKGLKTGSEYSISFKSDIPYLTVSSFFTDDKPESEIILTPEDSGILIPVKVDSATNQISFSIRFSLPFRPKNTDEKINTAQRITLAPFFPGYISSASLESVKWTSDYCIMMRWEGLSPGKEEPHFYKLTIPGGKNGISAEGLYMKENFIIYLEAVNDK